MIRKEKRTWDKYEGGKAWKEFLNGLSKGDYSKYQSYMGFKGNLKKTENKIEKLESQIRELKIKRNEYWEKMTMANGEIDHLRKTFKFNCSISLWKKELHLNPTYYMLTISRSGYKNARTNLGNVNKVQKHLLEYFHDKPRIKTLIRKDCKEFLKKKLNNDEFEGRIRLRELIKENPNITSIKGSLNFIFPISKGVDG